MDTDAVEPTFCALFVARVAELADAVDSKSTDASLVGSTPTPGTTSDRGRDCRRHENRACGKVESG